MSHELDRAIEAVKKFSDMFNNKDNGGGGGYTPESQGVYDMSLVGGVGLTMAEYDQAQKERAKAGIPLHEPRKPETSADKISALCDELKRHMIKKHMWHDDIQISETCDELKRFLLVKNERYGDSALKPIKVFSKGTPGDKIDTRMDDKVSRIVKSEEQRKNDFVDLAGYLVLKCIDKGWTDFSDLLD